MNEKRRERPENINHGATYGNRRLSIPSHSVIKGGREGGEDETSEGARLWREAREEKQEIGFLKKKEKEKRRGS